MSFSALISFGMTKHTSRHFSHSKNVRGTPKYVVSVIIPKCGACITELKQKVETFSDRSAIKKLQESLLKSEGALAVEQQLQRTTAADAAAAEVMHDEAVRRLQEQYKKEKKARGAQVKSLQEELRGRDSELQRNHEKRQALERLEAENAALRTELQSCTQMAEELQKLKDMQTLVDVTCTENILLTPSALYLEVGRMKLQLTTQVSQMFHAMEARMTEHDERLAEHDRVFQQRLAEQDRVFQQRMTEHDERLAEHDRVFQQRLAEQDERLAEQDRVIQQRLAEQDRVMQEHLKEHDRKTAVIKQMLMGLVREL
eukprot:TRINITY_DN813_c0_g1_i4.p1 TRINITY_DN813_c0_g1~~TRINITY_DN813_c0_g1_i4.p1  ORF type:complete len:314 (+),score=72.57 TRINITY_DN813_c0_g1_i4:128-1069(+)